MRINQNVPAINSWRSMYRNDTTLGKSLEKLSSGLRINHSSDDAGGLAISESMRAQVRGTAQAEKNTQDAYGLLGIADGTLEQTHAILQRMRELAVQAANGTYTANDRTAMNTEYTTIRAEIDRQLGVSNFNGTSIFNGGTITMQVGPNNGNTLLVSSPANTLAALTGGAAAAAGDITTQANAQTAITDLDTAIAGISTERATIGAQMNRLDYTIANLQNSRENLTAAESRIRDTDMASEMTMLTKTQILMQSSTAMLAQANARPQNILTLLQ